MYTVFASEWKETQKKLLKKNDLHEEARATLVSLLNHCSLG